MIPKKKSMHEKTVEDIFNYRKEAQPHCPVKSPEHYTHGGVDTWDFIAIKDLDFFEGNIVKYVVRWRRKGGVTDLEKAKAYLEKLISIQE